MKRQRSFRRRFQATLGAVLGIAACGAGAQGVNVNPLLMCIVPSVDYSFFTAYFGYESFDTEPSSVLVGPDNFFAPAPGSRGQVSLFRPGYRETAFRVNFAPTETEPALTWSLQGRTVSASWTSPLCKFEPILNIDNDSSGTPYDAATDGMLLLRYVLGYRGNALIADARGSGANVRSASQIESYLADRLQRFDVDGDGVVLPMTDGLMILRRLLNPGANGTLSVSERAAITGNAKRGSLPDDVVLNRIEALKP